MKLRTEAPVNGGRNYNGPKVNDSLALVKSGYMLEGLSIPRYLKLSDNVMGADNQQERSVGTTNLAREARGLWKGTTSLVP